MKNSILRQISDLPNLSHPELQKLWKTLYGKDVPAFNRPYIIKRLAYRIQELAYGGLSEKAINMMDDVLSSNGFDENGGRITLKNRKPKRKGNMPVVGTRFIREWNGRTYEVIVVDGGYEYQGMKFNSLTAIAKVITGTHWNGRAFFGSQKRNSRTKGSANK